MTSAHKKDTYLGQTPVQIEHSPFKGFTAKDWVMAFITRYGQIEGDHHKAWVIDQTVRLLMGQVPTIVLAQWTNHPPEYRFWLEDKDGTSTYNQWVQEMRGDWLPDEGRFEYDYYEGIAP